MPDLPERLDDLARLLVGLPWWRWMPGMLSRCSTDTRRAVYRWLVGLDTRHYGLVCVVQDKHGRPCRNVATLQPGPDDLPDLTDPATLGCLRAIVSELVGGPVSIRWVPHLVGGVWYAETPGALQARGPTEAHALIALALQVTP